MRPLLLRFVRHTVRLPMAALAAAALCRLAAPVQAQEAGTAGGEEKDAWQAIWDNVVGAWNHVLITVGDNAIRVSQIVLAVLIVAVGVLVSRLVTRTLRIGLLRRVHMDRTAAAAVEKILFYLLVIIAVVFGFQTLAIPITLFAFLGGALAIGIGFGAQNIVANFISGLILMFERPVRIGDFIEVENHLGRIEEIRFRCTRIRTVDGVEVLVPNSVLLEHSVINWTLSDTRLRASVKVGVIYGSPTGKVAKLIRQAVDESKVALRSPEPVLVFDDFGDNVLVFEVFFWTEVTNMMDLKTACSDIRYRIDDLFREAGLVIAFPQRDVHLDNISPIEVRLTRADEAGDEDAAPAEETATSREKQTTVHDDEPRPEASRSEDAAPSTEIGRRRDVDEEEPPEPGDLRK